MPRNFAKESRDQVNVWLFTVSEPQHDKTNKMTCAPSEDRPAWASAQSDQSSQCACRNLGSWATHWALSEDPDQTGQMPRPIWVFAGGRVILLVLSCGSSYPFFFFQRLMNQTQDLSLTLQFFHQYFLFSFPALASNCEAPACRASETAKHIR